MKELEIHIRQMAADDLDQVVALDQRSFPTPWPAKSFRHELEKNQAAHLWVAEKTNGDNKEIVGMLVIWLLVDEAHIATIAVDEAHRRQGIASALISTALSHLIDLGAVTATLEVRESNLAAQDLYRGFGFEAAGRRRAYYKDSGEDAIIMAARRLKPSPNKISKNRVSYSVQVNGGKIGAQ